MNGCSLHNQKEIEFYCQKDDVLCCSKCISNHLDCQIKGQFCSLEDIHENFIQFKNKFQVKLGSTLDFNSTEYLEMKKKLEELTKFQENDQMQIEKFFEELKITIEQLKESALQNYKINFDKICQKVQSNIDNISQTIYNYQQTQSSFDKIVSNINKIENNYQKQIQSVLEYKKLQNMNFELTKFDQQYTIPDITDECEFLINREEVFSELGTISLLYSNFSIKSLNYIKQNFDKFINSNQPSQSNTNKQMHEDKNLIKTIDPEAQKNYELKLKEENANQILNNIINEFDQNNDFNNIKYTQTLYHQLRYNSNEIYLYDHATQQFVTLTLYTTDSYKIPFNIFNNCSSAIIKNVILLFGGEDPSVHDRTSKRSFIINTSNKTIDLKVVVHELPYEMNFARQDFTLNHINNFIYLISGYDQYKIKGCRVIPKCEKFDLKTKKFYEIRDINYPRQNACSLNYNNTHIYVFNGQNQSYINNYVEKIEKYVINLNDWIVLKWKVEDQLFEYQPTTKSACFRLNQNEILILGGNREYESSQLNYYIFDTKNLVMTSKSKNSLINIDDDFNNQHNLEIRGKDSNVLLFSGNFAKKIYSIQIQENPLTMIAEVIKAEDDD